VHDRKPAIFLIARYAAICIAGAAAMLVALFVFAEGVA
jgi:hypothetical protein